jgi:hypothetical protein
MRTEVIPFLAERILEAAVLALLPIVLIAAGTRIINSVRDARVAWTPYVELAAFAAGIVAGVVVFGGNIDTAALGPSEVFRVGGTWDMSFGAFLTRVANPFHYDWTPLLVTPAGALMLAVAAAIVIASYVAFSAGAGLANAVRNAFLAVSGAYVAIYGLGYCLWIANRLNFWVFLLLMILIHMRSRSDKVVLKLH